MRIVLVLTLIAAGLFADGRADGRRGNEAYAAGDYESAAEAYQEGLAGASEEAEPSVVFGLTNNLGATRYRMDNPQEALEAFEAAAMAAADPAKRAIAAYNAGNAAFKAQDLERALAYYRRALLENPADPHAKFNYEFVKRQLQDQQGQQQPQPDQQQNDQQGEGQQQPPQQDQQQEQQDDQGQQNQDQEQEPGDQQQQPDAGDQEEQERNEEQQAQAPQQEQELSREQAERILQALESEEAELLREVQRMDSPARRVEKDW